jgi:cytochrome c peroxidase
MNIISKVSIGILALFFAVSACKKDQGDLTQYPYAPTPYQIKKPAHFPEMPIPPDNPMTNQGVQLGRMLFYDPILSADSSQSCSSCHLPSGSFTDNMAVSTGIDGIAGKRSAMTLLNIGYNQSGMFWDGRSPSLETQALLPIEDPIEMHNTWSNALEKLRNHPVYPKMFREAFGVNNICNIKKEHAAKAIAQFERILVSSGTSKFDQFMATSNPDLLDDDEYDGMIMYFDKAPEVQSTLPECECHHCHGGSFATFNEFRNDGAQEGNTQGYLDQGFGGVFNTPAKNGFFRSPSLINIALTAPYFHNGSAKTLEEVLEHYSSGGKPGPNRDPLIRILGNPPNPQGLTNLQKKAIIKFLHTMTDTVAIKNPDFQNPF